MEGSEKVYKYHNNTRIYLSSEIISPIKTEISESLEIIKHLTDAIKSQKVKFHCSFFIKALEYLEARKKWKQSAESSDTRAFIDKPKSA